MRQSDFDELASFLPSGHSARVIQPTSKPDRVTFSAVFCSSHFAMNEYVHKCAVVVDFWSVTMPGVWNFNVCNHADGGS